MSVAPKISVSLQSTTTSTPVHCNDPAYATLHVLDGIGSMVRVYHVPTSILAERSVVLCSALRESKNPDSSVLRFYGDPPRAFHKMLEFLQDRDINWNRRNATALPLYSIESAFAIREGALELLVLAEKYQIPSLRNELFAVMLTELPMLCASMDKRIDMSAALFLKFHLQPLEATTRSTCGYGVFYDAPWQRYIVSQWDTKSTLTCNSQMWVYLGVHDELLSCAIKLRSGLIDDLERSNQLSEIQVAERVRAIRHLGNLLIAFATSHQPSHPGFVEREDRTLDLLQDTLLMRSIDCVEQENESVDLLQDTLAMRSID